MISYFFKISPIAYNFSSNVLPKGAEIPKNFVESKYRKGSYGVYENGVYSEKVRIDQGTPRGRPGPEISHFHLNAETKHIFDGNKWTWWNK